MRKEDLEEIFISGKYKTMSKSSLINEIQIYIDNNPCYINEIKNFLRDNDKDLLYKYGLCFKYNAGVKCAFGIDQDTTKEDFSIHHIKIFKTLKPVYKTCIVRNNKSMTQFKKNNKKDKLNRYKARCKDKEENEEQIKNIKRRLKNNNN